MNHIHIVGAGGAAGVGMTRCLREHFYVTGSDTSPWATLLMEAEPRSNMAEKLVLPVPDSLVLGYAGKDKTFLPEKSQIELCNDKARTAEVLGNLAPRTYWVRDTEGAGGKGAQMASEILPGKNYSQEFVFYNGEKITEFQKLRVSYSTKHRTTGLENRGSSMVSVCTNKSNIRTRSLAALNKVAEATGTLLHGFYGVDLVEDVDGVPKVTEINAGRLLTASYNFFWLTDYNLPLVGVKAYFNQEPPELPDYPLGYGIVRQVDQFPRLIPPSLTTEWL